MPNADTPRNAQTTTAEFIEASPPPACDREAETVCVFLPNWIGDVVMATPALRALRQRFPRPTKLIGVIRPHLAAVLEGTPWLDDTIAYDRRSKSRERRAMSVVRQLRALRPDVAMLFTNSLYTGGLAWLSGASRRVGFVRNFRGWLLTDRLRMPYDGWKRQAWSAVDQYLALARAVGCSTQSRRLELATNDADEAGAEQVWRTLRLDEAERVVLVNAGAATAAAKMWPDEHVIELSHALASDPRVAVLLLCGPAERERVDALEKTIGHPRVRSMAKQDMSLGVAKAITRRSQLLITTDSGPRHIGAAFQTPTVAMFGSIGPAWSVNYNPHEVMLALDLPCSPCGKKKCPLGHYRCMRDLSVNMVLDAAARLLEGQQKKLVA